MTKDILSYKSGDVTFANSKSVPFQRWYPYIQGYSPEFVKNIIANSSIEKTLIYDPFAGTGTTIFASDTMGIDTVYSEVNPLLQFLISTKLNILNTPEFLRQVIGQILIEESKHIIDNCQDCKRDKQLDNAYKAVFDKSVYFPEETYDYVLRLRTYIDEYTGTHADLIRSILIVAVFSILLDVSYLKKQGDVRYKTEKERETEMKDIKDVLPYKLREISEDIQNKNLALHQRHKFIIDNAKDIGRVEMSDKISMVITSPPYLNGTNYIRNTKLELWFLRQLKQKTDLRTFRDQVLTSAICDVGKGYTSEMSHDLRSQLLNRTIKNLSQVTYDRRIPVMIVNYFNEMKMIFAGIQKHLAVGAELYVDLGDSIFSGIHVSTDNILTEILEDIGYKLDYRTILRQRRSRNQKILSQVLLKYTF